MHACPAFADTLVRFGECAHTAAELAAGLSTDRQRMRVIDNILRAMARFFWFSIEFGLMQTPGGLRACGSGLLSSYTEIEHAVRSPYVERRPFRIEDVIHQSFEIDHFQPLLYYIESFEQLYGLVEELERWLLAGKLNHVAPGEPYLTEDDLRSFLIPEKESDAIIRA
jgi:phenylalanine-4-hydroxylase